MAVDLGMADDDLASCVSCGLCLPHCPTYRVTGEESASPRGRIAAMRQIQWDAAPVDDAFVGFMDACVLCRGCETACPSDVPFGRLMAATRHTLTQIEPRYQPWWRRAGLHLLGHQRVVLGLSRLAAVGQRLRVVPVGRAGLPRLPLHQKRLRASGSDVWLFTGCVMDAWQRRVHEAVQRVLEATGVGVAPTGAGAGCCGALHEHAGLAGEAYRRAAKVVTGIPGHAPVLVDSAGCGAQLKDYGEVLGGRAGEAFAGRVFDVHEWLAPRLDRLPAARQRIDAVVAVQDPCHLRHAQQAHQPVREVLAPFVTELVELDDEGLCCGAGGAYAAQQPELAGAIRDRKLAAIERSGATMIASANPGCTLHLAAAGLDVRHPLEVVADALGLDPG